MYSTVGRPSVPPERLLRALLLQTLYTIRSERQLMEQLDTNLLFRWFVGLNPDDAVWAPTVFTKDRERLVAGNIADAFLHAILTVADAHGFLSHEHFTVEGTLLEAWASQKSFQRKDGATPPPTDTDPKNPTVSVRGEKRSNTTHVSVTDPDARLARKSSNTAATLCHLGSVLMDNRHGLIVATDVRPPAYEGERDAAVEMLTTLEPRARRRTLGADKGYDTPTFVAGLRRRRPRLPHHAACGAEYPRHAIDQRRRWPHDPACRLRREPSQTQARQRRVRMGEDDWRVVQAASSRAREGRLDLQLHERRVHPRADAYAPPCGGVRVSARATRAGCPAHGNAPERRSSRPSDSVEQHPAALPPRASRSNSVDSLRFSATC